MLQRSGGVYAGFSRHVHQVTNKSDLVNRNSEECPLFPSKAGVEWLEVGPSMSAQVFHLPPAKDRYIVRFDASAQVPGSRPGEAWVIGQLKSVNEHIVNVTAYIPFSGRYVLHTFDPVPMARSATAEAQLLYRLTFYPK